MFKHQRCFFLTPALALALDAVPKCTLTADLGGNA